MSRPLLVLALLTASTSFGWGFDGHRRLASLMQDALPQGHCLRGWFAARQTSTLQDHACDPDRWRATDPAEAPRHFLQIDWVNPITDYPRDYAAVVARIGARNASNNGIVPWHVEARYAALVSAFQAKDTAAILDVAFALSHYVFDSFSVLHDTRNFDPNNGLHARWESDMLNTAANLNGITTLSASYYGTAGRADPRNTTFEVVIAGNALVSQLVQADLAANGSIPALYSATRELTARRWGDGVTVMSSLLWSAWVEAGSPELTGFPVTCDRSAPAGEVVLVGYPAPKPVVDAGVPEEEDAGVDAGDGTGGGAGGGGGGGEPVGCGCGSVPPVLAGALLVVAMRRRAKGRS